MFNHDRIDMTKTARETIALPLDHLATNMELLLNTAADVIDQLPVEEQQAFFDRCVAAHEETLKFAHRMVAEADELDAKNTAT